MAQITDNGSQIKIVDTNTLITLPKNEVTTTVAGNNVLFKIGNFLHYTALYTNVTVPVCTSAQNLKDIVDGYISAGTPYLNSGNSANFLSVQSYGAVGDGSTDDTVAINNCITAALAANKDVFIPATVNGYFCNTSSTPGASGSSNKILRIDTNNINKIKIFGEKGTKIKTNSDTFTLLYIYNKAIDCVIENIFFENTHSITANQPAAIGVAGQNNSYNFKVRNCRFEGFSPALSIQGVNGVTISDNYFNAPKGHDNASNTSNPAVFVWFIDAVSNQCYDVKVFNNTVNGYSGTNGIATDAATTIRPMDGFVYGIAYGIEIYGNTTRNLCQEHYTLSPPSTITTLNYPVDIYDNQLYMGIPTGSMLSGSAIVQNYGIRYDSNNINVRDNSFFDYTQAILLLPSTFASVKAHGISIDGNNFYSPRSATPHVKEAIQIQGSSTVGNEVYNIDIKNNTIDIDTITLQSTRAAIFLNYCEKVDLSTNSIRSQNVTLGGFIQYGIQTSNSKTITFGPNTIKGIAAEYNIDATTINGYNSTFKEILFDNTKNPGYTSPGSDVTGDLLEHTVYTGIIKAGSLGKNGRLDIDILMSNNNNADNKTIRVKLNAVQVGSITGTASLSNRVCHSIRWRNSNTSVIFGAVGGGSGNGFNSSSGVALGTGSIDNTADITVTITAQLSTTTTNTAALETVSIMAKY